MPKTPPYAAFAGRLRTALKRHEIKTGKDLDQKDLAKALKLSGATVSSWFAGKLMPKVDQLGKLGKILDANPGWLAFGDQGVITGPDGEPLGSQSPNEQDRHRRG